MEGSNSQVRTDRLKKGKGQGDYSVDYGQLQEDNQSLLPKMPTTRNMPKEMLG
jgi:hypothetical protein